MPTAPDTAHGPKHPTGRPFPWHCPRCRRKEVNPEKIHYEGERLYGGHLFKVVVPDLKVPVCGNCGEKVFNYDAEEQILNALEKQLGSSPPAPATTFLEDFDLRPVELPANCPYEQRGLALGKGPAALEVLILTSSTPPHLPNICSLWRERNQRKPAPLLVVVLYGERVAVCGPTDEDPPAYPGLEPGQLERICRAALELPDRLAAQRFLRDSLAAVAESPLLGTTGLPE